jgi:CRP-like cAMP-binding protein
MVGSVFQVKNERPTFPACDHEYTNSVCTFTHGDFVTGRYVVWLDGNNPLLARSIRNPSKISAARWLGRGMAMLISKQVILDNRRNESEVYRRTSGGLVIPNHNLVLAGLPLSELHRVVSESKPVHLSYLDVIYEAADEIEFIYFPIEAVVSAVAILEDGSSVEISMTGREGLVGLPALVGGGRALHWMRVSVSGAALRIPTGALQELVRKSEPIHDATLRAYRQLFTQICQRSVCNVRHSLLQRLCVWLLMMSDRVGAAELPFTQEDIANRISVRRAGVSVAASTLQAMRAISYHRGRIMITDRPSIEGIACECYQVMAQDFEELRGGGRSSGRRSLLIAEPGPQA